MDLAAGPANQLRSFRCSASLFWQGKYHVENQKKSSRNVNNAKKCLLLRQASCTSPFLPEWSRLSIRIIRDNQWNSHNKEAAFCPLTIIAEKGGYFYVPGDLAVAISFFFSRMIPWIFVYSISYSELRVRSLSKCGIVSGLYNNF